MRENNILPMILGPVVATIAILFNDGRGNVCDADERLQSLIQRLGPFSKTQPLAFPNELVSLRDDVTIPVDCIELFRKEALVRGSLAYGFESSQDGPALSWEFDMVLAGSDEQATEQRIKTRLKDLGFEPIAVPTGSKCKNALRRVRDEAICTVLMGEVVRLVSRIEGRKGHSEPKVGTSISWTVRSTKRSPLPTYGELIAAVPALELPRIKDCPLPETFLKQLTMMRVWKVAVHGTTLSSFGLELWISAPPCNSPAPQSLLDLTVDAVLKDGFELLRNGSGEIVFRKKYHDATVTLPSNDRPRYYPRERLFVDTSVHVHSSQENFHVAIKVVMTKKYL